MRAAAIADLVGGNRAGTARLIVPPELELVVGVPAVLWFEQICLAAALPTFTMSGPGSIDSLRWTWTPAAADVGTHRLTLRALDGKVSTRLTVRPAAAAGSPSIKLHVVGASFEGAAIPVNWLEYADTSLVAAGVDVTWMGTQQAVGQSAHIEHEGIPGAGHRWLNGANTGVSGVSPYVFGGYGGVLLPGRYFDEQHAGVRPDLIIADLGANGYTTANLAVQAEFDQLIAEADIFHDALIEACPDAWICPVLAVPCSAALHALNDAHRQRRHRFAEMMLANLRARIAKGQRIRICQEIGCLDPINAFPVAPEVLNDHFDESGAVEIGANMYTFIRRFTG